VNIIVNIFVPPGNFRDTNVAIIPLVLGFLIPDHLALDLLSTPSNLLKPSKRLQRSNIATASPWGVRGTLFARPSFPLLRLLWAKCGPVE